ncbi:MAG: flagellar hook-length control protein FliK [Oscillospiraceae bacterium]|nr:flagellar hook-length control protein FliK [Oscillospiraceae bacterium]
MEKIQNGMLEMMQYISAAQMNLGKLDVQGGESEFGKLLEQKSGVDKNDTVSANKKESVTKDSRKEPVEKTETKPDNDPVEKPNEKEEELSCDVAREVACAQMVWMIPQTVEQPVVQEEVVEAVADPVLVEIVEAEVPVVQEMTALQEDGVLEQPGKMMQQETVVPAEQPVEEDQIVQTNEQVQPERVEQKEEVSEMPEFEIQRKPEDDGEIAEEVIASEKPLFHDVETAPIKVAEAPEETQEAASINEQISHKLDAALKSGETKVEILLEPEALGKVSIELTHRADGTLSILLHAENTQTRGLLERHMNGLQEALVDRGQQNVQIEVSHTEETERQNDQQNLQDNEQGNHPQRQRRQQEHSGEDFLQQLRLGLISMEDFA